MIAVTIFGFSGLGLLLAFIVERLYTNGVIIDELMGSVSTISEVQALIVIVFLVLGVVVAAVKA